MARGSGRKLTLLVAVLSAALFNVMPLGPPIGSVAEAAPDSQERTETRQVQPGEAYAGVGLAARERSGRNYVPKAGEVLGMDVSSHQGNVDWPRAWADGARFAYVKATEGTTYRSPNFGQHYNGSHGAGMIRGAYHFALPDASPAVAQADFFIDNGGGWTPDGRTLPPALDIEYNPYGETCYNMDPQQMSDWIAAFSDRVAERTGRFPTIYTTTDWWTRCTGNNPHFAGQNPLWVARYAADRGPLPAGWGYETIWQYNNKGVFPGDQNRFNGSFEQLQQFARG